MKLKTLIADDEPLARERLRLLLANDEEIEIVGECRNAREVVSHLKSKHVDLLFLDIQMPGKTGFDIFEEIGTARMPLTVFVTAHHQHAVKAFDVHALDYLTKPIEQPRLNTALTLAKERLISNAAATTQHTFASALANLENKSSTREKYPKRLLIPNGAKNFFVTVNDIEWVQAADYYSCLHVGTDTFLLRQPIKQLSNILDPERFVRIHRSAIVNVDRVCEILREGKTESSVLLASGRRLKMSKVGWQRLLATSQK
jgi:two-component system LytT family response regulator